MIYIEHIRALVRPTISLSLTTCVIVLALKGTVPWEALLGLLGPIIGFYFGEKAALKSPNG